MQREYKKLAYKVARGVGAAQTLQELLCGAVKKYHEVGSRIHLLGADGGEARFVNFVRQHQAATFGAFHKVTKGAAQHVINMEGKGDSWEMMTVTAKSEARPHGEFVEGTLFFGVWKNHVVLHQTMSCRAEQFEDYLSWLAAKLASDGGDDGGKVPQISLDDPLPKSVRAKDSQPVKNIKIAGTLESKPLGKKDKKGQTHSAAFNFTPSGGAWEGIKAILKSMGAQIQDEILLASALEDRDLRVRLELSCTKKNAQSSAGDVLGKLGHALRHTDGDFYTVQLTDGTIIKGQEIKIERPFRVECSDRLPSLESMFKAMMEFFEELVKNQTIIEQDAFGNTK
jgi:hypothetical protein